MTSTKGLLVLTFYLGSIYMAESLMSGASNPFGEEVGQPDRSGFESERSREKKVLPRGSSPQGQSLEVIIAEAPFMGSENAKVTLVEFSDYQCFFCRRHDRQVAPKIVREFVETGKVKYVFRDFPLSSHPGAFKAAQAAHCAGDQGKYWEMNDLLFKHKKTLREDDLRALGKSLGLNIDAFLKCVESKKHEKKVEYGLNEGRRVGVRGTPSFFLGLTDSGDLKIEVRKFLVGAQPYLAFKRAIEALLAH